MRITIFCKVIDNLGDAGIGWRLARQLAAGGHRVCLLIDDLNTLHRLRQAPSALASSVDDEIDVQPWRERSDVLARAGDDLWLETFACGYGEGTLEALAQQAVRPRLIHIDHLSAEDWARACHRQTSIHPATGLRQTYHMPGFTADSGGLLREPELLALHQDWRQDREQQQRFLQACGVHPDPAALLITVFCYPQALLDDLLLSLRERPAHVLLLGPGADAALAAVPAGSLPTSTQPCRIQSLDLLHHRDYDRLLGLADFNIVRGEDSWVRAQWAARPLLWQAYLQDGQAHLDKLEAWLRLHPMPEPLPSLHRRFNAGLAVGVELWTQVWSALPAIAASCQHWREQLAAQEDLVSQLLRQTDDA